MGNKKPAERCSGGPEVGLSDFAQPRVSSFQPPPGGNNSFPAQPCGSRSTGPADESRRTEKPSAKPSNAARLNVQCPGLARFRASAAIWSHLPWKRPQTDRRCSGLSDLAALFRQEQAQAERNYIAQDADAAVEERR